MSLNLNVRLLARSLSLPPSLSSILSGFCECITTVLSHSMREINKQFSNDGVMIFFLECHVRSSICLCSTFDVAPDENKGSVTTGLAKNVRFLVARISFPQLNIIKLYAFYVKDFYSKKCDVKVVLYLTTGAYLHYHK